MSELEYTSFAVYFLVIDRIFGLDWAVTFVIFFGIGSILSGLIKLLI